MTFTMIRIQGVTAKLERELKEDVSYLPYSGRPRSRSRPRGRLRLVLILRLGLVRRGWLRRWC